MGLIENKLIKNKKKVRLERGLRANGGFIVQKYTLNWKMTPLIDLIFLTGF